MNAEVASTNPPRYRVAVAILLVAVVAAWTFVGIRASLATGRLRTPPGFDDVAYQVDAARRIDQFHRAGITGFFKGLWERPPKSPYSTGADIAAIAIIGDQNWAPYVTNVLVLGVLVWIVWRAGRGLRGWSRIMLALLSLALPISLEAVAQFRPDILSGLLVAAGCMLALEPGFNGGRRAFIAGLVFGAGAFVKPTAAPAVGVVACAALGLGCMIEQWGPPTRDRARLWFRGMLTGGIGAAILPGLYAIIGTGFIINYLQYNLRGQGRTFWVREMSTASSFLYYITGPGGDFILGPAAIVLVTLALASGVYGCIRLRGADRARAGAGLALLALTYLIATTNPIKQIFFGVQFQALVILLAAQTLARVAARIDRLNTRVPLGGAILAVGVAVACTATFPLVGPPRPDLRTTEINAICDQVFEAVRDYTQSRSSTFVFQTFVGHVNSANLEYRLLRAGRAAQVFSADGQSKPEGFEPWLKRADLVLAVPASTTFDIGRMPTGRMLDESFEMVMNKPEFRVLRRFPLKDVPPKAYSGKFPAEVVLLERVPPATP